MGRGPKDIHTHLIGDLLVVRLQGVLTAAEQHLVRSLSPEKGRDLLKEVRTQLIEAARPVLESLVEEVTGVKVLSLHHDISTATGEEVVLFTLADVARVSRDKEEAGLAAAGLISFTLRFALRLPLRFFASPRSRTARADRAAPYPRPGIPPDPSCESKRSVRRRHA